jgi:NitT/TauT family transport system permease protein
MSGRIEEDSRAGLLPTRFTKASLSQDTWYERPLGRLVLGAIPFFVLLAVWQVFSAVDPPNFRFAIPHLGDTTVAFWEDISSPNLYSNLWVTTQEFLYGVGIALVLGVGLGIATGLSRVVDVILYPIVVLFQAVPKPALAPLLVLTVGFGIGSKVVIAAFTAFFPILVATKQGLQSLKSDEFDLMRSLHASPVQLFFQVRLRRAIPAIFAGLQVGVVFALLAATVTEFLGSTAGIGFLIFQRSQSLDMPGVYSALILLSVLGLVITLSLSAIGDRLSRWTE